VRRLAIDTRRFTIFPTRFSSALKSSAIPRNLLEPQLSVVVPLWLKCRALSFFLRFNRVQHFDGSDRLVGHWVPPSDEVLQGLVAVAQGRYAKMMPEKPNVLVLMADQLRRCSLSVYGDPNIQTPNIDQLARMGVRFSQANTTYPICVPARFTFITGQYAHSRFIPAIEWRMSPAETTIADYFNSAGYHTCYIGKWHLYGGHGVLPGHTSGKANRSQIPRQHQGRFQKWQAFDVCNAPWNTYYFNDGDPTPIKIDGYQTDGLTDLAIDYLQTREGKDQPFFCVLSVEPPHFPMEAPRDLEEKWLNTEIVLPENFLKADAAPSPGKQFGEEDRHHFIRHIQLYYAMLENLDQNVGRILSALEDTGQADNTVILFFSDHGEMQGAHAEHYWIKDHPYEESVGIPLFLYDPRFPDRQDITIGTPTCMEDIMPTLLGAAGLDIPDTLPGKNLHPLATGHDEGLDREGVMLEFVCDTRKGKRHPMPYHEKYWRAFRTERYKYSVLGGAQGGEPWQFFDLQQDPLEMTNLLTSPDHQGEVRRHHQLLHQRLIETADHFVLKPAYGCGGLNEWQEAPINH